MKHLTIVVPEGQNNNLSSIVGTYKILSRANVYWKENHGDFLLQIDLAGISKEIDFYDGLFYVKPKVNLTDITKTQLIIIPSLNHDYTRAVQENQFLIDWLKKQ